MEVEKEVVVFLISFTGGVLWYRLLFFLVPMYFKRPLTRSVLKWRWHHLHWGALLSLVGAVLLLGSELPVFFGVALLGIGLGFIFDLFVPVLVLETNREEEITVYQQSLVPTFLLGVSAVVVLLILSVLI